MAGLLDNLQEMARGIHPAIGAGTSLHAEFPIPD